MSTVTVRTTETLIRQAVKGTLPASLPPGVKRNGKPDLRFGPVFTAHPVGRPGSPLRLRHDLVADRCRRHFDDSNIVIVTDQEVVGRRIGRTSSGEKSRDRTTVRANRESGGGPPGGAVQSSVRSSATRSTMSIPVACPGCHARLNAPDAAAGKAVT